MKRIFIPLLLSIFLFTTAFKWANEGDDITEKIATKLKKYIMSSPQEKVYLHLDKPYYRVGETIWIKAYLFDGIGHSVDSVSRVLYVDLLDESSGSVVISKKMRCNGSAHGEIALPDSLSEGNYTIRSYTNYMRNFSDEFFFYHTFKIWKESIQAPPVMTTKTRNAIKIVDMQFFPESGHSVVGLPSRVGFKALASNGLGIEVTGFVMDDSKDTILSFQSEHLGMGMFSYTPLPHKKYTAFLQQIDGSYQGFPLPKAEQNGYSMVVDNTSNTEKIKVFVSKKTSEASDSPSPFVLVAHMRGQLCFITKGNSSSKTLAFVIPKKIIPGSGVVHITLMDTTGAPICERLVFHNDHKQLNLQLSTHKTSYNKREKVTLTLEAKDNEGKPVEGDFSLSVTDKSQVTTHKYQQNILSYMLLSSDVSPQVTDQYSISKPLHGYIEQPAYYFDPQNLHANRHLDILMMTQGWRKFNWNDVLVDNNPNNKTTPYFVETDLEINGKVSKLNGKIASNVSLTLMYNKQSLQPVVKIGKSDSLGYFTFYDIDFNDTTTFLVQAIKGNGNKNLSVNIFPQKELPKVNLIKIPLLPLEFDSDELLQFLKKSKDAMELEKILKFNKILTLQEVVVKGEKQNNKYDDRKIHGVATKSIKIEPGTCSGVFDVFQLLQTANIAGLQISPGSGGSYYVRLGGFTSILGNSSPLFVVDGLEIPQEMLASIRPCDVESIDVLKGPEAAIYGSSGSGGVIAFFTKRGNSNYDYSKDPAMGISLRKLIGYNIPAKFYAPKYNVEDPSHNQPDFRATLHWQAHLKTNTDGKASFSYWNSDAKATMQVIAEGVSSNGSMGSTILDYSVR